MRFTRAEDVRSMALFLNENLSIGLDLGKVEFIRSYGSRSRAYARTFSLPSQWRYVLNTDKLYVIEVISEKFDRLSCEDKAYVVIHELMHIPTKMTGGLRNHSYAGFRRIRALLKKANLSSICRPAYP
ncbi:putative metallopeptidase [Metallosphaera sp. D4-4]|uniref:putative metallopeptidase n=1 Tax=Metallosphaera sp. D4-4 TaxID=3379815 RepID=UPI003908B129